MNKKLTAIILAGAMAAAAAGCGGGADGPTSVFVADPGTPASVYEESGEESSAAASAEAPESETGGEEPQPIQVRATEAQTMGAYGNAAYLADRAYQENGTENTIVSPLSLNLALGLAANGAVGETAEELYAYLGREDYDEFEEAYMQYVEKKNYDTRDMLFGGYQTVFEIANSIWIREDRKLVAEYAEQAAKRFQAKIESVVFAPPEVKQTVERINSWCNEKTHGMIPSIVSEDKITSDLAVLLINSLYFEAPWEESWGLIVHDFTNLEGREDSREMLTDTLSCYFENEYATGFSKYYMNGLEFIGILPKQEGDFTIGELDLESFMKSRRTDVDVVAIMPKMDFETEATGIANYLQDQGVTVPFDARKADFSKMVERGNDIYISDIIQKCKIELDEDGTRAAAVTAIMMKDAMAVIMERERKEVYLDRPFAFMIYDAENDQIAFLGKVVR